MKKRLFLLAASLSLVVGIKAQSTVNWNITSDYNSLYTGQSGAFLSSGNVRAANAPENVANGNYYNVWQQSYYDDAYASSIAIGVNNNTIFTRNYMSGSWTEWNKYWHSGNLNRSDADFNAKDIFTKRLYASTNYVVNTQFGTNPGLTISLSATAQYNNDNSLVFATSGGILLGGISGRYDSYSSGTASGAHLSFYTLQSANSVPLEVLKLTNTGNAEFSGNVLIGQIIPTNTAYKLNVAGSIRADEIKVNTTGADFVFDPTYKLRPLAEVETFIKTNKHLPDIIPAAEMQINGVSMGEMQAKLLQKVEELTLYSIEQDKQLQEQRQSSKDLQLQLAVQAKQNAELKQEVEALKQFITQKLK